MCPSESTMKREVIRELSMVCSAAEANSSGETVRGLGRQQSPAALRSRSGSCSSVRRRSPSEITPMSRPSESTTAVMPIILRDISWIAAVIGVAALTCGTRSPVRIRSRTLRNRRPSDPPGWSAAKSSSRKPCRRDIEMAIASPIASIAAVEAVGTRFQGHASRGMATEIVISAARATDDSAVPVMTIVRIERCLANSSSRTTSGVAPE